MNDMEIKKLLSVYVSNTVAGTSNNSILNEETYHEKRSRIFYRVEKSGALHYRFCFSNCVDSTYEDGSKSRADTPGGSWEIAALSAGDGGEYGAFPEQLSLTPLTFGGAPAKAVQPKEVFFTDDVCLTVPEGHYLCVEIVFSGTQIPYTPDKIIPSFSFANGDWVSDCAFPQPVLVGCDRAVKQKIAFLGDSITQGLGTTSDGYAHWAAVFTAAVGSDYGVYNLGLGCARASDAAADGAWLPRCKEYDTVFVCFGVNDIFANRTASQICADLTKIIRTLKQCGCKVILLSTPPFDMTGENAVCWYGVNDCLQNVVAREADGFVKVSDVLGLAAPYAHKSAFGSHPDDRGGKKLGELLGSRFQNEWAI